MKKLTILFIALLMVPALFAQDFIITTGGETIRGQIIEVTDDSITYQVTRNGIRVTNTLPRSLVADFGTLSEEEQDAMEAADLSFEEPSRFRLAITLAYARRLGRAAEPTGMSIVDDLNRQIRNGLFWETELQYYFTPANGIALNINGVHTSATAQNNTVTQHIIFAGPGWATRLETCRFRLSGSVSLGALFFNENARIGNVSERINAVTVGMSYGIGAEYRVSPTFGVGLRIGYTFGSLSSLRIEGQTIQLDDPMSLSNLFIGTVFSFTAR